MLVDRKREDCYTQNVYNDSVCAIHFLCSDIKKRLWIKSKM